MHQKNVVITSDGKEMPLLKSPNNGDIKIRYDMEEMYSKNQVVSGQGLHLEWKI